MNYQLDLSYMAEIFLLATSSQFECEALVAHAGVAIGADPTEYIAVNFCLIHIIVSSIDSY